MTDRAGSKRRGSNGFELSEEKTINEETSVDVTGEEEAKPVSNKQKPNTIRIKIAPKIDLNQTPGEADKQLPSQSLINIEQLDDLEHPIALKINNKQISSGNKFESVINFPETIDIMINSPETTADIKLPSDKTPESESSTSSPKTKLADTASTSSDLRSLFEAYKTDTSNFSTAFKPSSGASSKQSSKATTPQTDAATPSTTIDTSPDLSASDKTSSIASEPGTISGKEQSLKSEKLGDNQTEPKTTERKEESTGKASNHQLNRNN